MYANPMTEDPQVRLNMRSVARREMRWADKQPIKNRRGYRKAVAGNWLDVFPEWEHLFFPPETIVSEVQDE